MPFNLDEHWANIAAAIVANPHQRAVVGGRVFFLNRAEPNSPHPEWLGFDGTWHEFHFADGLCVISNNVIHNGEVPPQWRSAIPDNAILLRTSSSSKRIVHQ